MMNIGGGVVTMIQRGRGSIHHNHVNHASGSSSNSNGSGSGSSSYDDSSSEYDSSSSHDSRNSNDQETTLIVTTIKPATSTRTRFPSPTASSSSSSSSSPFINYADDNEAHDGNGDIDVDPIIDISSSNNNNNSRTTGSNIIASSILSSIAAATAMLRQRRHPGGFVSQQQQQRQRPPPHGNEPYRSKNSISQRHPINLNSSKQQQRQHVYCDHRFGVSKQQRRHNPNMKLLLIGCDMGFWNRVIHDNLPCRRILLPHSMSLRSNHNDNDHNRNNNRTKRTKRKRKSYPTTIHTLATYILGICILTWFVVLIWSFMNYNINIPSLTATTMLDNDDTLQHLPLHERANIRRSRLIDQRRRNHKSSRNWLVRFGLWINSLLFGGITSNVPSKISKNIAYKNVDSEELPKECQRSEWQSKNYPTCNDIYEIDLPNMIRIAPRKYYRETGRMYRSNDNVLDDVNGTVHHEQEDISSTNLNMGYVAQGYWRSVWAVHPPRNEIIVHNNNSLPVVVEPNVVVLKTLRRSHELSTRNYDRHRRDAIVMEQLTSSPYVMNIYGFCGNSVMTEYMDLTLEDIAFDDTQYPIIKTDSGEEEDIIVTSIKRIQLALEMVRGVQAIHEIRGGPIVHADLQAKQFLISRHTGTVKINDFNRCRFMASKHINRTKYDGKNIDTGMDPVLNDSITTTTTLPCKFRIPSAPGVSRSPEEYMDNELDEKIDVYALGHVLYNLLSYREPWDGYHTVTAQQRMMNGEIPNMDQYIPNNDSNNQSSPIHALSDLPVYIQEWYINITKRAYTFDPTVRSSAAELALELESMLAEINKLPSK